MKTRSSKAYAEGNQNLVRPPIRTVKRKAKVPVAGETSDDESTGSPPKNPRIDDESKNKKEDMFEMGDLEHEGGTIIDDKHEESENDLNKEAEPMNYTTQDEENEGQMDHKNFDEETDFSYSQTGNSSKYVSFVEKGMDNLDHKEDLTFAAKRPANVEWTFQEPSIHQRPAAKGHTYKHDMTDRDEGGGAYRQWRKDETVGRYSHQNTHKTSTDKAWQSNHSPKTPYVTHNWMDLGSKKNRGKISPDVNKSVPANQSLHLPRKTQIPAKIEDTSRSSFVWVLLFLLFVVIVAVFTNPLKVNLSKSGVAGSHIVKAFQEQFKVLQSLYPTQSGDLWKRSRKILELHLQKLNENKQPAIILLTAARDAEKTLLCLSRQLAKAYSNSRNSSYTVIAGTHQDFQDSEEAKHLIDDNLSSAFQSTSSAAVLHRLELLPPGSLLILYKYCDHENAAFKNVALVLTVLLEEPQLESGIALTTLEEKVRDYLNNKFLGSGPSGTKSHKEMDVDKFGGVWSRIAHVVLPVLPESKPLGQCEEGGHEA
ncbi:torsin-1A-interacting protein 1-like [Spea bombifrons]|uniref:torsin-1A-interacting protein 1-like n=1 Tax=Spea bombifrons TaxID=233779 RepID=UPI00234910A5|nr:torsin-1A-interacting protein 1-like [Spea bombifrons]